MASETGESTLDEWETIVTPMFSVTIRRLTLNSDLEAQLVEKRLIGLRDLPEIKNKKNEFDQKMCLFQKYLYARGPGSLRLFIDALKKAGPGNESLAKTLDQEYRKRQNRSEGGDSLVVTPTSPAVATLTGEEAKTDTRATSLVEARAQPPAFWWCTVWIYLLSTLKKIFEEKVERIQLSIAAILKMPLERIRFFPIFVRGNNPTKTSVEQTAEKMEVFIDTEDTPVEFIFPNGAKELFAEKRHLMRMLAHHLQLKKEELKLSIYPGSCIVKTRLSGISVIQLLLDATEPDSLAFLEKDMGSVWVRIGCLPPFCPSRSTPNMMVVSNLLKSKVAKVSKQVSASRIQSLFYSVDQVDFDTLNKQITSLSESVLTRPSFDQIIAHTENILRSFSTAHRRLQVTSEANEKFLTRLKSAKNLGIASIRHLTKHKDLIGNIMQIGDARADALAVAREREKESVITFVEKGTQEAIRSLLARAQKAENENEELKARLIRAQKAENENEELKIQNTKQRALEEELRMQVLDTREMVYRLNYQLSEISKENEKHKHSLFEVTEESERRERILQIPVDEVEMTEINLGGGSYGEVKVGYWRGCFVAVKSFYEILDNTFYHKLFWQEVAVSREFHHPNVIVMYGATLVDGRPLQIITELLEGSLADVIKAACRCPQLLSLKEQIDIALGITAGINYLHRLGRMGVLHGDIRSSNILITSLMEAKVKSSVSTRFADSDLDAGPTSPEYLAPERFPERSAIRAGTTMTDVYSMGVTLIELMTHDQSIASRRFEQASRVAHPIVKRLCYEMVSIDPELRPAAYECFKVLEEVHKSDEYNKCPPKRMVKGKLHGEETVTLTTEPWPKYHHTFP